MYQNYPNAIQRARKSSGLTQESLAERCGYSDDSIRSWESGRKMASLEALGMLAECLGTPWLTGVYLREQTDALNDVLPDFRVGRPLAEAAAEYITCMMDLVDGRFDRKLLRMVADGQIDALEAVEYQQFMELAERMYTAYFEMKFAKGGR